MIAAIATVILPISAVTTGAGVFLIGQAIASFNRPKSIHPQNSKAEPEREIEENPKTDPGEQELGQNFDQPQPSSITPTPRQYREAELWRIVASLKANKPILVVGEEGSGKSVLAGGVISQLVSEGFAVAICEPSTPKQMLVEIAEQLGVKTYDIEGKNLTAEGLKNAIAVHLKNNSAFLVIDDAHTCELKFRLWLKNLKRQGTPILLFATDPPKTDVFLNLPRIELTSLPEYAIRELMEQAALEQGISLKPHQLARLQERVGGNPMLAQRVIDEEKIGLDIEAGDHRRYADATPLLLLVGVFFIVIRFIGLGTGDQALYIFAGIVAAIFLGISRLMYYLPRESRRIKP